MKQGTLGGALSFSGVGIHTGADCTLTIKPAAENFGRRFRADDGVEIPARVDFVVGCERSTVLGRGDSRIHTPEHVLSALASCGVDNALLEMTGPEVPILDGAALEFVKAIAGVGVVAQQAEATVLRPTRPLSVGRAGESLVLVLPSDELCYEYVLFYDHPMLGCQSVLFTPRIDDFATEIAPARTFALWEEIKPLVERGLAKGGSVENALVIFEDKFSSDLTVKDEPVRHKCLDLIGDFALLDARIEAKILAVKAGHRLHVECAKLVWEEKTIRERC